MATPLEKAIDFLKRQIAVPSVSRDEAGAASVAEDFLREGGATAVRYDNNVVAWGAPYRPELPTLMLNAHLDTVRPASTYTFDPFTPQQRDGCIYGLGSNDDGGSVAALATVFLELVPLASQLHFNLLLALSAEEEVGGERGMRGLLPRLRADGYGIDMAIVGEPTGLRAAVAEKGLIVLDCVTRGVSGHAARNEGVNAIYRALDDIRSLLAFRFPRESAVLGPIKVNVTMIDAGTQHNTIPDECRWVVDVRPTDAFSNLETVRLLAGALSPHTTATPRSTRLQASAVPPDHLLLKAVKAAGIETFISPTTSDISQMGGLPAIKIGPGESARSHSADEFIRIDEVADAIEVYRKLILNLSEIIRNR